MAVVDVVKAAVSSGGGISSLMELTVHSHDMVSSIISCNSEEDGGRSGTETLPFIEDEDDDDDVVVSLLLVVWLPLFATNVASAAVLAVVAVSSSLSSSSCWSC